MTNLIIGIDVAKLTLDVCYLIKNKKVVIKKYNNDSKGFEDILNKIQSYKARSVNVCLEATGTYGYGVAEFLHSNHCLVSVVNPMRIKSYKNIQLSRNKTDRCDAKAIAEYCDIYKPTQWHPDSDVHQELKDLYRCLNQHKEHKKMLFNRLENNKQGSKVHSITTSSIQYIQSQIEKIEKLIDKHIKKNKNLSKQVDLIQSIPGFGKISSIAVIAELPDFKNYTSARSLAAHAGLTPMNFQSGTSVKKRPKISKIGASKLRTLLYFPALTAKTHNPIIKPFADKLLAKGKKKMVVVAAVMRKLIHIVFGILKSGKKFNENILDIRSIANTG